MCLETCPIYVRTKKLVKNVRKGISMDFPLLPNKMKKIKNKKHK
jgi:Fe-S oxidoreductase